MAPVAIRLHGRSEIKIYGNILDENLLLETSIHNNDLNRFETGNTFSLFREPLFRLYQRPPCNKVSPSFIVSSGK
jgi:hypothetical protein